MSSNSLIGRRVLITGAARGIGAATARELGKRGARVSLVGSEPELLTQLAAELGTDYVWYHADMTDCKQLDAAINATAVAFGGVDAVVANVDVGSHNPMAVDSANTHHCANEVDFEGLLMTAHATLPALQRNRGYFLIVASLASSAATPGMATYCSAAAEHLATGLQLEWSGRDVVVASAHPTWLGTDQVPDTETGLSTSADLSANLPDPLSVSISAERFAAALADAVAARRRDVHIPTPLR